jgi:hypothetical protein
MKARMAFVLIALITVSTFSVSPAPGSGDAQAYTITVQNQCGYDLYIRGAAGSVLLPGDNTMLAANGGSSPFVITLPWSYGRIYGCWDDTIANVDITNGQNGALMQEHCALVEETIQNLSGQNGNLFSNISFVDAISVPIQIQAPGGFACTNSGLVKAAFAENTVTSNCPTKVLNGKSCISAYHYCHDYCVENPSDPVCSSSAYAAYCSKFATIIQDCKTNYPACTAGSSNTIDVYGCAAGSFFSEGPPSNGEMYCAAINRGILPSYNNQTDPATFYPANGTYNDYAAFVHSTAGPIFGFSYDDWPSNLNQGGYLNCQTSTQYIITFCPTFSTPGPRPAPVPALNEWGTIIATLALICSGLVMVLRKKWFT